MHIRHHPGLAGRIALAAAVSLLALGASILAGWALLSTSDYDAPARRLGLPSSALCFIALGSGLLVLNARPCRWRRDVAVVLGLGTMTFAVLALLEGTHRLALHMVELFMPGDSEVWRPLQARIPATTALNFTACGLFMAILALSVPGRLRLLLGHALLSVPLGSGLLAFLDRLLSWTHVLASPQYEAISPPACVGILLLAVGLLARLEPISGHTVLLFQGGAARRVCTRAAIACLGVLALCTAAGLVLADRVAVPKSPLLAAVLLVDGLFLSALFAISPRHLQRLLEEVRRAIEKLDAQTASRPPASPLVVPVPRRPPAPRASHPAGAHAWPPRHLRPVDGGAPPRNGPSS